MGEAREKVDDEHRSTSSAFDRHRDHPPTVSGESPQQEEDISDDELAQPKSNVSVPGEIGQPQGKKRRRAHTKDTVKKYICDWEGCTKGFSRPDHLARHALNHAPTKIYTCDRCQKEFVRSDLLVRHLERHEKRESINGNQQNERRSSQLTQVDDDPGAKRTPQREDGKDRTSLEGRETEPKSSRDIEHDDGARKPLSASWASELLSDRKSKNEVVPSLPPSIEVLPTGVYQHSPSLPNIYQITPPRLMQPLVPSQPPHHQHPSTWSSDVAPSLPPLAPWAVNHYNLGYPAHGKAAHSHPYGPPRLPNLSSAFPLMTNNAGAKQYLEGHGVVGELSGGGSSHPKAVRTSPIAASPSTAETPSSHSLFTSPGMIRGGVNENPYSQHPLHHHPPPFQLHHSQFSQNSFYPDSNASSSTQPGRRLQIGDGLAAPGTGISNSDFNSGVQDEDSFMSSLNLVQASYGAPFVSASEYDWLFDVSGNFDFQFAPSRPVSPGTWLGNNAMGSGVGNGSTGGNETDLSSLASGMSPLGGFGMSPSGASGSGPITTAATSAAGPSTAGMKGMEEVFRVSSPSAIVESQSHSQISDWNDQYERTSRTPSKGLHFESSRLNVSKTSNGGTDGRGMANVRDDPPKNFVLIETPPDMSTYSGAQVGSVEHSERTKSASDAGDFAAEAWLYIDDAARLRIIDWFGPEWSHLRTDRRMSCAALQRYLYLWWGKSQMTQAIHRPTFRASEAPTPLVISLFLLGCYFAELEAHQLAVQLHSILRGKVIQSSDFKPRAEIWLHQTLLFTIVFGKLCSNRIHHEMAHIFWSSLVTLGRRSALFSQRTSTLLQDKRATVESRWAAWIDDETAKRTAHIGFGIDVEHAAFFRHSPSLSAFQVQLCLPCDEEEWEASTAEGWSKIHEHSEPLPVFVSALKASLMPGHTPPALNPLSKIVILHGLMSVSQDLQWRDHVIGLSQPEGRSGNWRDMISAAYNSWKSRLDTGLLSASPESSKLLRASISLYAIAHITVSIDIHELQIFAGAENALGLKVSMAVREATSARIRIWSASKDGRAATWHAAHFLRSSLQNWLQSSGDLVESSFHHKWAVYIACLTLICFGTGTAAPFVPNEPRSREGAMRFLDSMCTQSPENLLAVSRKNNVLAMSQLVLQYIQGSRWEIAQEGARLLRRYVVKYTQAFPRSSILQESNPT